MYYFLYFLPKNRAENKDLFYIKKVVKLKKKSIDKKSSFTLQETKKKTHFEWKCFIL